MPILVSTITTIVVFFPVLFLFGIARNLFLPLALTISFALVMSFFVSRTVTPLLCLMVLDKGHPEGGVARRITGLLEKLDDAYASVLTWVLHHRARTIAGILPLFVASLFLSQRIATEFFPDTHEPQFTLASTPPSATPSA